jgi:hypothetical protein
MKRRSHGARVVDRAVNHTTGARFSPWLPRFLSVKHNTRNSPDKEQKEKHVLSGTFHSFGKCNSKNSPILKREEGQLRRRESLDKYGWSFQDETGYFLDMSYSML